MSTKLQGAVLVVCGEKPPNKRMNDRKSITGPELIAMASERGMKGYHNLKKSKLAKRLGMELPKPTRREESRSRKARRVEVFNSDGTTTVYPSISKAAQVLGEYPMQIYVIAVNGGARFLN